MIPFKPNAPVSIEVLKMPPEGSEEIAALAAEYARAMIARLPGCLSTVILESRDGERVVTYSEWTRDTERGSPRPTEGPAARKLHRLLGHLARARTGRFQPHCRIPSTAAPTLAIGGGGAILLGLFHLHNPDGEPELLGLVERTYSDAATADLGLRWAEIFRSSEGRTIAALSRWDSADAYESAMARPRVKPWLRRQVALCAPDVHLFEVVDVIRRAEGGAPAAPIF
jgi:heme-degrading monooxygenase HmoA